MSRFIVAALALALCSANTFAIISTPHVAGSHQGWDPGSNLMTDLGGGIYSRTYTGLIAGARHEYKVTDGTWSNTIPGPNSWFIADPLGEITLYYDTNTYADGWSTTTERLGQSYDPGTWTAAGDFQSEIGGSDWDNANAFTAMAPVGGGVYQLDAYPGAGTWQWKAVRTGSWDSISFDTRSTNTANWSFILNPGEFARLSVDGDSGIVKQEILPIPEPASIGLVGLAAMGLLGRRRDR